MGGLGGGATTAAPSMSATAAARHDIFMTNTIICVSHTRSLMPVYHLPLTPLKLWWEERGKLKLLLLRNNFYTKIIK